MGGSRLSMRALHSRPERREVSRLLDASGSAGVLSRGVGLRGFESHPPHHTGYPVSNGPGPGENTPVRMAPQEGRYRERTITSRVKLLNGLSRRADLFNPEAVKGAIARLDVTEGRKEILVCVYGSLCRLNNIPFL